MIPEFSRVKILTSKIAPTKTYHLETGAPLDGLEALEQAICFILETQRYEHIIYSWQYGFESEDLYGKDIDYVKLELQRRIEEALKTDDRINDVGSFLFKRKKDALSVQFIVNSVYGKLGKEVEIAWNMNSF